MSTSQAEWSADGRDIPSIDLHTKAKHQILEKYIENLIITLYGKGRYGETKFTFIDGFCGGGIYKNSGEAEWFGSPIKMIQAVREGFKKSKRKLPLDVQYIFIDAKKAHLDCLKNYAMRQSGLDDLVDEQVHEYVGENSILREECKFENGEFESLKKSAIFIASSRKGHSFFFLDPFGWSDVSMETIRMINDTSGSEILYTYMINFLKRFVIGKYGSSTNTFEKILESKGYYEKANIDNLDSVGEQLYLRNESMRLFRDKGFRKNEQKRYLLTFSLMPRGEKDVLYYLMHMSKNITALEVIKERFWEENNLDYQYHFEVYGYGFRNSDYYDRHQLNLQFDVKVDNYSFCVNKLDNDLGELIKNYPDGITFKDICHLIGQINPASRTMYEKYINLLRDEGEIEILRKNEVLKNKYVKLQRKDVIRIVKVYQMSLIYNSRLF